VKWTSTGAPVVGVSGKAANFQVHAGGLVDIRPSAAASFSRSGGAIPNPDVLANSGVIQVDRASLAVGTSWNLNNTGTLRLMAGGSATLSSAAATNAGTIDLQSGSSLLVNGDQPGASATAFRVTAAGVVRVAASATATLDAVAPDGVFDNAGLIELNGGRLTNVDYTLANAGTLRVNSGAAQLGRVLSNTGTITVGAGSLQVTAYQATNAGRIDLGTGASMTVTPSTSSSAPAFLNAAGGVLNVGPGATASFAGTYSNVMTNAGTVTVDHGQFTVGEWWAFSNTGAVTVTAGTFKFYSAATFTPYTNTGSIDLRGGAGLVVARPTSFFTDAAQNLKKVRDQIVSGFHAGAWDGPGIRSASAAADPTTAVGYAVATGPGTFLGVSVATGDVLVRHTKVGDATLDGTVNFNDLLALAKNYNATGAHWYQGDFSYDGTVNFSDLLMLAKNYNAAMPAADALPGATAAFEADLAAAFAQVPEPSGGLLAMAAGGLVAATGRRRRVR
jgi:hypothetical protein